jgi:hypothetical protein
MRHEKRLLAMLENRNRWALDAVLEHHAPDAERMLEGTLRGRDELGSATAAGP